MTLRKRFGNRYIGIILGIILCILSSGKVSWSQIREERINVNLKNASLKEVIGCIEHKTSYRFFYSENLIEKIAGLNYKSSSVPVSRLLTEFLANTNLTFSIDGRLIIIKLKSLPGIPVPVSSVQYMDICGIVRDKNGETLPGVNVYVKHMPKVGITTNADGVYAIRAHLYDTLCYSFIGYHKKEIVITNTIEAQNVFLKESSEYLDEVMIVGYGRQRVVSVVGAISTLDMKSVSQPVIPVSNMLAGRLTGLIGVQHSGEPGSNFSEFWIRGISTFGANRKSLILIDGIERDNLDDLVPSDIEHFSILKDATATAIYGARGGNGVVLVNTKRGHEGKLEVNLDSRISWETLPRLPRYLGALDYVRLVNEARLVRGENPDYLERDMQIIRYHLDPDLYPDVNWQKEVLRDCSPVSLSLLSITGGNRAVKYYISGNVKTDDAIYKGSRKDRNKTNRVLYGFRSNFDIQPRESLKIAFDIMTEHTRMNRVGGNVDKELWQALADVTPVLAPVKYSNGMTPSYGKNNKMVPTTLLYETGYRREYSTLFQTRLAVTQDCRWLLNGLSVEGTLSFDNRHISREENIKSPALYRVTGRKWEDTQLIYEKRREAVPATYLSSDENRKSVYLEGKINYSAIWKMAHRLDVLALYNQRNFVQTDKDEYEAVPYRNQGLAGRISYSYDDIYLTEFNFGYTGTENFPRGERFGFFPSIALGWVLSNYSFCRHKLPYLTFLKLRYSMGLVGNDKILNKRFPDLTFVDFDAEGYVFGDMSENIQTGVTEKEIGSGRIKWEIARKRNIGLDLNIDNRLLVTFDWFQDHRQGIFMRRESLPDVMGVFPQPYGNWGKMRNWGFDGDVTIPLTLGDWNWELSGTFTYTRDEIEKYEEAVPDYPYQKYSGNWNIMSRGLVALGLFKDEEDVRHSPSQFGKVLAGDVKYKDVNGDGTITDDDIVPIGYGNIPKLQYGITFNMSWKDFYFRLFFRGAGRVNFFYGGTGFFPFADSETGNVLSIVDEPGKRWIPSSYSGSPATENPAASFPRLTYGENSNNNRPSTFWLADGSYFRFKNIEIGYCIPRRILKKIFLSSCRLAFIGDNLAVRSKVKLWDPEQASSNGAVYPITRSYTVSLSIGF